MCWNMLNPRNIVYAECQGRIELPGAGVLFKDLMGLPYGCSGPSSSLQTSLKLITDPQPHTRQQALQILTALGQQHHGSSAASSTVDAIFQRLCVVAATDSIAKMRLQALQALAGFHHASTAIKLQALSKKATLRFTLPSTPAAGSQQQQQRSQQPPAKKQRQQQQQPEQADAGLLDAATGAFVHGTEDDLPRVRLAAVAAVVSLSSQDTLFADAAGLLLSDLVGDQLLEVRLAALQALLEQATVFQQRKQPQQQQQQEGTAAAAADAADTEMQDAEDLQQEGDNAADIAAATAAAAAAGDPADPGPGSGAVNQQQQQQQQQRRSKPRKSDLPPWGKDALLAAADALSDREHAVRALALQLLQQLPPGNAPDLVTVMRGVAACCERYPGQNIAEVWRLVGWLGSVRAEMVTLAPGKLVLQLASMLLQPAAPAAAAAGAGGSHGAAAAAAAEAVLGSAAAGSVSGLPPGAQALAAVMLLGVQQRRQGVAALLKELEKAQLMGVQVLQPWLHSVHALQQQQQGSEAEAAQQQ